ncbi:MAG: CBS domain-containing protein [Nitrospiraceae bacterium]
MKVKEIMTGDVQCCSPQTNLAAAAKMMWDSDCGILPVLDVEGKVMGMITDRDICMAAATKNRPPSEFPVWETITGNVYACSLEDDIDDALNTMANEQVRRLPVVDEDGVLRGMLSLNDIVLQANTDQSYESLVRTLKAISRHRTLAGSTPLAASG